MSGTAERIGVEDQGNDQAADAWMMLAGTLAAAPIP